MVGSGCAERAGGSGDRVIATRCVLVAALLAVGCSDEAPPLETPSSCGGGARQGPDGTCVPAGVPPDLPCPPGEWQPDGSGACVPAGVSPNGCAEGFVHDGDRGCTPVLPPDYCTLGAMAVPGDMECGEVLPCGAAPWGDIPVETSTEHVDGAYAGMDSDGTAGKPWTSIQAAIDAAAPGAIVAIAMGSYVEDIRIEGKAVRLWGRCPSLVEVVGSGNALAAIFGGYGAHGTELRGLAVRGDAIGVLLSGSTDVVADNLWIHDNADRGFNVENTFGTTELALSHSLIERNADLNLFVAGSDVAVLSTVVRDGGRGVSIEYNDGVRATVDLDKVVIERNVEVGLFMQGSDLSVLASVVRDTRPNAQGAMGQGITVQIDPILGSRPTLTLRSTVVQGNRQAGCVATAADVSIESTVSRGTRADDQGAYGNGLTLQDATDGSARTVATVRGSLIDDNQFVGLLVGGSDATLEGVAVRRTLPDRENAIGYGLVIQHDPATGQRSTASVRSAYLEANNRVGLLVGGSDATVETTWVRDTAGRGINVQASLDGALPASASILSTLVEGNAEIGLGVTSATVVVEQSTFRNTAARDGLFGDGVTVFSYNGPATLDMNAARVELSTRAAISNFGAHVAIGTSALVCQSFDLDAEVYQDRQPSFDNRGNVACGCPEPTGECEAVSATLQAPGPLAPIE